MAEDHRKPVVLVATMNIRSIENLCGPNVGWCFDGYLTDPEARRIITSGAMLAPEFHLDGDHEGSPKWCLDRMRCQLELSPSDERRLHPFDAGLCLQAGDGLLFLRHEPDRPTLRFRSAVIVRASIKPQA